LPRNRPAVLFGVLAIGISLVACGQPDKRSDASSEAENTESSAKKEPTYIEKLPGDVATELANTEWTLVSLYGSGLLDGTSITLNVEDDGIGGSTGCNYYGGKVLMEDGVLKERGINSTKVGCPGEINQQESAYLHALGDAASYRVRDGQLEIQDVVDETTLIFAEEEQRDMDPADLVGTAWRLYSVDDVPAPEGLEATLYFSLEGRIRGYGGCGSYSGSYDAEGDDITIIGLGMEEIVSCNTEDSRTQMAGLGMGPYDYLLGEDRLELYAERGNVLVFIPLTEGEKADLKDRLSKEKAPRPEPPGLRSR
jgi:heat shock protein HslJ